MRQRGVGLVGVSALGTTHAPRQRAATLPPATSPHRIPYQCGQGAAPERARGELCCSLQVWGMGATRMGAWGVHPREAGATRMPPNLFPRCGCRCYECFRCRSHSRCHCPPTCCWHWRCCCRSPHRPHRPHCRRAQTGFRSTAPPPVRRRTAAPAPRLPELTHGRPWPAPSPSASAAAAVAAVAAVVAGGDAAVAAPARRPPPAACARGGA
mmetsp:Transcript_33245/g.99018  ORF Transcript_33245/g.99018 Transcript_33245/m.99018 type:complete len:211 (-) Transcript_33245:696-1328(-)